MSLPTKGSRKLVIDDQIYRGYIRKQPTYCQEVFHTPWTMAVQLASGQGAILMVSFAISRPDNIL